ncbi:hypothetical protein CN316_09960 [Bacillus cereus]|nr:hypothetical protein CN316_09960 [Bacillus cereus]
MFKNMKLLLVLFICMTVLLAGCGGTSGTTLPYKKGETYKDSDKNIVEITADNEWRVKGYQSNEASYKVEPMEYKGGQYSVISISLKEKFSKTDPWLVTNDYEYYLLSPMKTGFSLLKLGSSHPNSKEWKEFKEKFESANDKEAFLKKEMEGSKYRLTKFEKTN